MLTGLSTHSFAAHTVLFKIRDWRRPLPVLKQLVVEASRARRAYGALHFCISGAMASRGKAKLEKGEASRMQSARDTAGNESEYDEQSAGQFRAIRSDYRNLKAVLLGDNENLVRDPVKFTALIGQVDNLYRNVKRPREQISDAEVIYNITSSLLECAKSFQRKTGPTPADFVTGIIQNFQKAPATQDAEMEIDWTALGLEASGIFSEAPGLSTMLGPMDRQPKQRKSFTRRHVKAEQLTQPEEVEEAAEESQKAETDKNMETMFRILRSSKCVSLEALVLNSVSFAQTVENLFALSFLIKDGRVEMRYADDGRHLLVPRNAPTGGDRASGKVRNSQFVFRFDYKDWMLMKEAIEEGSELMPHRLLASTTPIRNNCARKTLDTHEKDAGIRSSKAS